MTPDTSKSSNTKKTLLRVADLLVGYFVASSISRQPGVFTVSYIVISIGLIWITDRFA